MRKFLEVVCVSLVLLWSAGCGLIKVHTSTSTSSSAAQANGQYAQRRQQAIAAQQQQAAVQQAALRQRRAAATATPAPGSPHWQQPGANNPAAGWQGRVTPQSTDPSLPDYRLVEQQHLDAERARQEQLEPFKEKGQQIAAELDQLRQKAEKYKAIDSTAAVFEAGSLYWAMAFRVMWCDSDEGVRYRSGLKPAEREAWEARIQAAAAEAQRLESLLPSTNGGGYNGGGYEAGAPSGGGYQEDPNARRNACLAGCSRNCPSPYGSGDQWASTNATYSMCMNQESSCRSGCY